MNRDPLIDLAWLLGIILVLALWIGGCATGGFAQEPIPAHRRVSLTAYPPGSRLIVHWQGADGKEDVTIKADVLTTEIQGTQSFATATGERVPSRLEFLVLGEDGKRTRALKQNPYVVDVIQPEKADYDFEYYVDRKLVRHFRIWDLRTSDIHAELLRRMSTDTLWLSGDPPREPNFPMHERIDVAEAAKVNMVAWKLIRTVDESERTTAGGIVEEGK